MTYKELEAEIERQSTDLIMKYQMPCRVLLGKEEAAIYRAETIPKAMHAVTVPNQGFKVEGSIDIVFTDVDSECRVEATPITH